MCIKSFIHTIIKFSFPIILPEDRMYLPSHITPYANLKFNFYKNCLYDTNNYPMLDFLNSSSQNW